MHLCVQCFSQGFCRGLSSRLVTDRELDNPAFLGDVRAYAGALRRMRGVSYDAMRDVLVNGYRDYPGRIVDADGQEVMLNLAVFEDPSLRYWMRDFACAPCKPGARPRLRREARERMRVFATILRALDPVIATSWGIRAANEDSVSPPPPTMQAFAFGCPYKPGGRGPSIVTSKTGIAWP